MKIISFTLGIFLMLCSCKNGNPTSLSQAEMNVIPSEISAAINIVLAGWNLNKINTLFPIFANDAGFTYVGIDGELYNYNQLIKIAKAQFENLEYGKYTLTEKKIKVIDAKTAVAILKMSCEFKDLKGIIEKYEKIGCTLIFEKIGSEWLVTHFQESTLPGVIVNPEVK